MLLYAGCSRCGAVVPLWCAGQFMPHQPYPVAGTPMGPACGFCGPLRPVFTCTICWTPQMLYLPGSNFMQMSGFGGGGWGAGPGAAPNQLVAPVVQAQPGAAPNQLGDLFKSAATQFVKEFTGGFGKQFGQDAASAMSGWMSGSWDNS